AAPASRGPSLHPRPQSPRVFGHADTAPTPHLGDPAPGAVPQLGMPPGITVPPTSRAVPLQSADVGVAGAHVGIAGAHVGIAGAHVGIAGAHVGVADAHVGVADAHVGEPDPSEAVSLPRAERAPTGGRDVLAGWGWSTGSVQVIADD